MSQSPSASTVDGCRHRWRFDRRKWPGQLGTGLLLLQLFLLAAGSLPAEPMRLPSPGPGDTCPVCGMFVAKYPDWVATVLYTDGHAHHFDGAKDLFKYLLDLPRWAPRHQAAQIRNIAVSEYYSLARIDAHSAWYVLGSDVLGPMGHELIPLESREAAREFMLDHSGKRILRFDQVDLPLLRALDLGTFE